MHRSASSLAVDLFWSRYQGAHPFLWKQKPCFFRGCAAFLLMISWALSISLSPHNMGMDNDLRVRGSVFTRTVSDGGRRARGGVKNVDKGMALMMDRGIWVWYQSLEKIQSGLLESSLSSHPCLCPTHPNCRPCLIISPRELSYQTSLSLITKQQDWQRPAAAGSHPCPKVERTHLRKIQHRRK